MNVMLEFNNKLKIILLIAILFIGVVGKAQFRLMVTPSLEIPIVFQGNPGYNSTFGIKAGGFYEWKKISLGLSVGYQSFSPSEVTLHKVGLNSFLVDSDPKTSTYTYLGTTYGERVCYTCAYTEEFGNLSMIPILIEWNRYLSKIDKVKISVGLNMGVRIYSYSHIIRLDNPIEKYYDPNLYPKPQQEMIEGVITTERNEFRLNLSPKIAFEYLLTNKFSLYFEPAINLQTKDVVEEFNPENSLLTPDYQEIYPGSYEINQMFTASLALGFVYNFGYSAKVTQRKEVEKKQSESEKIEWKED